MTKKIIANYIPFIAEKNEEITSHVSENINACNIFKNHFNVISLALFTRFGKI